MDLKQLRYYVEICDAGSISRAAKILYVAQPALSNHISAMEAHLGVELLHRSSRGVTPTESGEILYAEARRILRDISQISEQVRSLQENPVGRVAIGIAEAQSNILDQVFLQRMAENFPGIELHYTSGQSSDLYRKLQSGMLDICLIYKEPEVAGVDSRILLEEDLFIVMAYQQEKEKPNNNAVTLEELRKLPFIFPRKTHFSIRKIVENAFDGIDLTPQVVAEVDSFNAIKRYVANGLACTILPWSALFEEVENKTIMVRPIEGVPLSRSIDICVPLDRPQSIAIQVTKQLVIEVIKEMINSGRWQHARLVENSA